MTEDYYDHISIERPEPVFELETSAHDDVRLCEMSLTTRFDLSDVAPIIDTYPS